MIMLPLLFLWLFNIVPPGPVPVPAKVMTTAGASILVSFEYANATEPCATHIRVTYSWPSARPSVQWRFALYAGDLWGADFIDSGQGPMNKSVVVKPYYPAYIKSTYAAIAVKTAEGYAQFYGPGWMDYTWVPEAWETVAGSNVAQRPCRNAPAAPPLRN